MSSFIVTNTYSIHSFDTVGSHPQGTPRPDTQGTYFAASVVTLRFIFVFGDLNRLQANE